MANLYATVTNEKNLNSNRGRVTQCAHKEQTVHIRSWESGIRVEQFINGDGEVVARVYLTEGSNGYRSGKFCFETVDGELTSSDLS